MRPAEKIEYVRRYFELLTSSDIKGIVDMFEDEGFVLSPFLGKMRAAEFFRKLDDASNDNKLTVFDVLLGENGNTAAAHFEYDWTLKSGEQFLFQGIDYFKFSQDSKFASMSIYYDTHPVREEVGDKYANA